jgi:hypothetical protein
MDCAPGPGPGYSITGGKAQRAYLAPNPAYELRITAPKDSPVSWQTNTHRRTAKVASADLTRALAAGYDRGIQMNAVALGSTATERCRLGDLSNALRDYVR